MFRIIFLIFAAFAALHGSADAAPAPHEGSGLVGSKYDDLVKQYCGNTAYHCLYLARGETTRLTLNNQNAEDVPTAQSTTEGLDLWVIQDGVAGQIEADCDGPNGRDSKVTFIFSNDSNSRAETVKGNINGIFKSMPGKRLEGGPIHSSVHGDGLSLYCPLSKV